MLPTILSSLTTFHATSLSEEACGKVKEPKSRLSRRQSSLVTKHALLLPSFLTHDIRIHYFSVSPTHARSRSKANLEYMETTNLLLALLPQKPHFSLSLSLALCCSCDRSVLLISPNSFTYAKRRRRRKEAVLIMASRSSVSQQSWFSLSKTVSSSSSPFKRGKNKYTRQHQWDTTTSASHICHKKTANTIHALLTHADLTTTNIFVHSQ